MVTIACSCSAVLSLFATLCRAPLAAIVAGTAAANHLPLRLRVRAETPRMRVDTRRGGSSSGVRLQQLHGTGDRLDRSALEGLQSTQ